MTHSPAELACAGLVVSAGDRPVLRGVDLTVPAGSRTALVGPSGAGKTTLLRAIAGLAPVIEAVYAGTHVRLFVAAGSIASRSIRPLRGCRR